MAARPEIGASDGKSLSSMGPRNVLSAMVGTDGIDDAGKPVAFQEREELAFDPTDETGSLVDERGIELDQTGPGTDLGVGIGARCDAADPNQRQRAAGQSIEITQCLA